MHSQKNGTFIKSAKDKRTKKKKKAFHKIYKKRKSIFRLYKSVKSTRVLLKLKKSLAYFTKKCKITVSLGKRVLHITSQSSVSLYSTISPQGSVVFV